MFISPEAQFLLLLYLMVRLKKLLSLLISVGIVNTYFIGGNCIKFSQASLKSKHAREKQKQKIKRNRSIAVVKFIETIQYVFHQIFLKQKKKSKWVDLKNSKRCSECPFKSATVRNLEHLETVKTLFSLKLNYSIGTSVTFWLSP